MELFEKTDLGKVLKKFRIKKKLSQEALAEKIHCSRISITNIENGAHKPNYELLCRWLKACGQHLIATSSKKKKTKILDFKDAK